MLQNGWNLRGSGTIIERVFDEIDDAIQYQSSIVEANIAVERANHMVTAFLLQNEIRSRIEEYNLSNTQVDVGSLQQKVEEIKTFDQPTEALETLETYESLMNYIDRVESLNDWNKSLPTENIIQRINRGIRKGELNHKVIIKDLEEFETLRKTADEVMDFIEQGGYDHLEIDVEEVLDDLNNGISNGNVSQIQELASEINRFAEATWTGEDLFNFTWEEFEYLIARLLSDLGYSTEVTSSTGDRGIDVYARNDREVLLVQVKQNSPENDVGRPTVQKSVGALSGQSADRVLIITTASFTETAVKEARRHGRRVELIAGQELLKMLNQSRLAPPEI